MCLLVGSGSCCSSSGLWDMAAVAASFDYRYHRPWNVTSIRLLCIMLGSTRVSVGRVSFLLQQQMQQQRTLCYGSCSVT
jgi:hypothetical protein